MKADRAQSQATSALVLYRPLVEKVVAALGALVTHQLAYLVASLIGLNFVAPSDHGHLSLQWAIVAPVAVGSTAAFIVWQLKSLGFRSVLPVRQLSALVVGFFLIQETIEGLAGGYSVADLASHPAIAAGVLIGPLVAWVMSRALAGVTEIAARLLARPLPVISVERIQLIPVPVRYSSSLVTSPSRPRAPPSSLRT